jgi:hypothetical protein
VTSSFLSRWSKRKQGAKAASAPVPTAEPPLPTEETEVKTAPPPLPDVESLDKDSDYSGFLAAHVPPGLRQQALDKLWASSPGLMAPETMDLHMGDYTSPVTAEVVKTAWRLGKGVLEAAELAEEEDDKAAAKPTDQDDQPA